MRNQTRRLSAAGVSTWMLVDTRKINLQIALGYIISNGATLTASVQHTFDNYYDKVAVAITRVTTTATLVLANHGLVADDYLVVQNAGAPFDGEYTVASVVDANTVTYTVSNSGLATAGAWAVAGKARVFPHDSMAGMTARTDGNYAFPPRAVRLAITAYTSGFGDLIVTQQG